MTNGLIGYSGFVGSTLLKQAAFEARYRSTNIGEIEGRSFDTLVCAGDYARGKPAPDPFLLAAEQLGVAAKDCLVFEDAEVGIQAATAAGMASVRIAQPHERIEV